MAEGGLSSRCSVQRETRTYGKGATVKKTSKNASNLNRGEEEGKEEKR